jgi:hypothetical protein
MEIWILLNSKIKIINLRMKKKMKVSREINKIIMIKVKIIIEVSFLEKNNINKLNNSF